MVDAAPPAHNNNQTGVIGTAGSIIGNIALNMIPGYSALQSFSKGDWGTGFLWLGIDALVLFGTFGTLSPVFGALKLSAATARVAKSAGAFSKVTAPLGRMLSPLTRFVKSTKGAVKGADTVNDATHAMQGANAAIHGADMAGDVAHGVEGASATARNVDAVIDTSHTVHASKEARALEEQVHMFRKAGMNVENADVQGKIIEGFYGSLKSAPMTGMGAMGNSQGALNTVVNTLIPMDSALALAKGAKGAEAAVHTAKVAVIGGVVKGNAEYIAQGVKADVDVAFIHLPAQQKFAAGSAENALVESRTKALRAQLKPMGNLAPVPGGE